VVRSVPFHRTTEFTLKFVPFTKRVKPELPAILLSGLILVIVGTALVTVNPSVSVPVLPSSFCTTTSQVPFATPARLKSQVIWMPPGTTTTLVPSMGVCPVFCSWTVAPSRKFVPARSVMFTEPVFTPVLGVMPVTVGAGCPTVKPSVRVPFLPSSFSTYTSHLPTAAPVRLKSQVIWVPEGTFTLVPSISVSPDFFSFTIAGSRK
jgi:hypothetical protein